MAWYQGWLEPASGGPEGARRDPVKGVCLSFPFTLIIAFLYSIPWLVTQNTAVIKPALGSLQWASSPVEIFAETFPLSVRVGSLFGLVQGGWLLLRRVGAGQLCGDQGTFGSNVIITLANAANSALLNVIWGSQDCCGHQGVIDIIPLQVCASCQLLVEMVVICHPARSAMFLD